MKDPIRTYLRKRADLESRPLISGETKGIDQVVVIPVLAERKTILKTLTSLATNPAADLERTLVICVVNNRERPLSQEDDIRDNQDTLAVLDCWVRSGQVPSELGTEAGSLRLGVVDASSAGFELPPKGGVGLARKIGLDWGLSILADSDSRVRLLSCLDADTFVEQNYLDSVRKHFEQRNGWAAVVSYCHPIPDSKEESAAIICYEIFLRYHVLGLFFAGSPYAFPSVGSTMVCSAEAYAAVSGMNQRQAGEDFYFLQQLAKTGRVDQIFATTVYPSCRPSHRVPFGTGQRVRRFLSHAQNEYVLYSPESYRILKAWLHTVRNGLDADADRLLVSARDIDPRLADFVDYLGFRDVWPGLQENAADTAQLLAQFHRWFDGFTTIKLIHFLRDNGFPECEMFASVRTLLDWLKVDDPFGVESDIRSARDLLELLRGYPRNLASNAEFADSDHF